MNYNFKALTIILLIVVSLVSAFRVIDYFINSEYLIVIAQSNKNEIDNYYNLRLNFQKIDDSKVEFVSHRGINKFAPENSMLAFELAQERGFKYVELDIFTTLDGQIIVFHDRSLDRIFGIDKDICDVDFEFISNLSLLDFFLRDTLRLDDEQIQSIKSIDDNWIRSLQLQTVPNLEYVFEKFGNKVYYELDVKDLGCQESLLNDLISLIEKYELEEYVFIESRKLELLEEVVKKNQNIKIIYWNSDILHLDKSEIEGLKTKGVRIVDMNHRKVDIHKLHKLENLKVFTYTVNSSDRILKLSSYVDFIITDLDIFHKTDKYSFFNQNSKKIKIMTKTQLFKSLLKHVFFVQ